MAAKLPRKEKLSVSYDDWKCTQKRCWRWRPVNRTQHDFDFEDAHWSSEAAKMHTNWLRMQEQHLITFSTSLLLNSASTNAQMSDCVEREEGKRVLTLCKVLDCHSICLRSCHLSKGQGHYNSKQLKMRKIKRRTQWSNVNEEEASYDAGMLSESSQWKVVSSADVVLISQSHQPKVKVLMTKVNKKWLNNQSLLSSDIFNWVCMKLSKNAAVSKITSRGKESLKSNYSYATR